MRRNIRSTASFYRRAGRALHPCKPSCPRIICPTGDAVYDVKPKSHCMVDLIIRRLEANELEHSLDSLTALLTDAVESGASVGFVAPIDAHSAAAYWLGARNAVEAGNPHPTGSHRFDRADWVGAARPRNDAECAPPGRSDEADGASPRAPSRRRAGPSASPRRRGACCGPPAARARYSSRRRSGAPVRENGLRAGGNHSSLRAQFIERTGWHRVHVPLVGVTGPEMEPPGGRRP